jgi:hypothetical protein
MAPKNIIWLVYSTCMESHTLIAAAFLKKEKRKENGLNLNF